MNVGELLQYFEQRIPCTLSCEWDNDGLMLSSDSSKEVRKVLLTLDLTQKAVEYAINIGADAVFTHHPLIFRPMKNICDTSARAKMIFSLISHNIAVFSYHTRLDAVGGGVNDILASLIGLKNIRPLGDGELSMARIGEIEECQLDCFAKNVKMALSCPSLCVARAGSRCEMVSTVAVLGGASDKDFISAAIRCGADVFVTGDASYNSIIDANIDGMHMICAGHYYTEAPVLSYFADNLASLGIQCEKYDCGYFDYI